MSDFSNNLFADPSFLEGMGRVLDFGDTMTDFNRSLTSEQADSRALFADWLALGGDLQMAMESVASRNRR